MKQLLFSPPLHRPAILKCKTVPAAGIHGDVIHGYMPKILVKFCYQIVVY